MCAKEFVFGRYRIAATFDSSLYRTLSLLKVEFPQLVMCHKRQVWWMRVLHGLIWAGTFGLNRRFLSHFTSTGPKTIYLSDKKHEQLQSGDPDQQKRADCTLCHERIHLRQFQQHGIVKMVWMYIFKWFVVIFASGRVDLELPAYIETLACWYRTEPQWARNPQAIDWLVGQFTGPNYGWMGVFREREIRGYFERELKQLEGDV